MPSIWTQEWDRRVEQTSRMTDSVSITDSKNKPQLTVLVIQPPAVKSRLSVIMMLWPSKCHQNFWFVSESTKTSSFHMQSVSLKLHSGIPSFSMYIYSIYLDKTSLVFTYLKTSGQMTLLSWRKVWFQKVYTPIVQHASQCQFLTNSYSPNTLPCSKWTDFYLECQESC